MIKIEVNQEREIVITLTKQEAARLRDEMDCFAKNDNTFNFAQTSAPFQQIRRQLVSALYQAMRETDHVGPVAG